MHDVGLFPLNDPVQQPFGARVPGRAQCAPYLAYKTLLSYLITVPGKFDNRVAMIS